MVLVAELILVGYGVGIVLAMFWWSTVRRYGRRGTLPPRVDAVTYALMWPWFVARWGHRAFWKAVG